MGIVVRPGIVTGLHGEAALANKYLRKSDFATLIVCVGPGPVAAQKAAEQLVGLGVSGLISFGFAGGIDETVQAGTVLIAKEIRKGRQDTVETDARWSDQLAKLVGSKVAVSRGSIAASDEIVRSANDKTRMRYKTGALAADMESFAIGTVARDAGLPFITIRAISDPALQSLPIMAVDAVGPDGKLKPWRIAWSLIRHPGQFSELLRLAKNTRSASDSLGAVCRLAGPNFAMPDYRGGLIRQLGAASRPRQ